MTHDELASLTPCVVERPGARPYKAKKPPAAQYWSDDECSSTRYGVVVVRTHDIETATDLAIAEFRYQGEELPDPMPQGVQRWLRLVPWGGDGGSYEDVPPGCRGSIPCVSFEVFIR
jgi:hypothetical protein